VNGFGPAGRLSRAGNGRWSAGWNGRASVARRSVRCRPRCSGSRTNGATSPHTTHLLRSPRIEYRHHPYHQAEVKIIRALRSCLDQIDIVQLPEGTQIAVPRWMLDPVVCQQLPQESKPRIALQVLLRLLAMLKTHPLPGGPSAALSDLSPSTKGRHVSEESHPSSPGAITSVPKHALAAAARTDSSAVSSVIDPTHPTRRPNDHA
jgi:hypothetical protein